MGYMLENEVIAETNPMEDQEIGDIENWICQFLMEVTQTGGFLGGEICCSVSFDGGRDVRSRSCSDRRRRTMLVLIGAKKTSYSSLV